MPETEMAPTSNGEVNEDLKKSSGPSTAVEKEENAAEREAKKENINGDKEASPPKDKEENEEGEKSNGAIEEEETEERPAKFVFTRTARNRVKLYVLCEQRVWDDRGTGHVACLPLPDKSGFSAVVVRLEANEKNVLESKILIDTVYQKQQETLIVWSETESTDLALSFQEKSGCEELWQRICEVQGKDPKECMPGSIDTEENDDGETSENASGSGNERSGRGGNSGSSGNNKNGNFSLPPMELGRLNEIEFLFLNNCNTNMQKERFANAIEAQEYIPKMCELFRISEDIENTRGITAIYNICKTMFTLNKNGIVETLLNEDHLRHVVGILEYDPINPEPKPHREFLFEKAQFREILPLNNPNLREKIHQAYRVQYVQDVCLPAPSLFEENNLSVLNSYIFFLRVDIVTLVQENKRLMSELFGELCSSETETQRRRELTAFLKELCTMSSTLQQNGPTSKEAFYKCLLHHDLLKAIEPSMRSNDDQVKTTMTEILHMIVEYNSQAVREFILFQSKDKAEKDILLNLLLNHIVSDRDSELSSATMMLQVMRMLLDPEHMAQKGEKNEFLHVFYTKCLPVFTAPLVEIVAGVQRPKKDDYHTAKKLSLVLRLLNFCVGHHALPMRTFIIRRDFLNKVLVLLSSRHHFLGLYSLKLLRSVIQQKDEFYYNYVTEKNVFDKVVECLVDNGRRNNLLNSSVIEIFEFMRQEDMKPVIAHIVERHMAVLQHHNYVKTFRELQLRYDQNKDREEQMRRQREEGNFGRKDEGRSWKNREREMEKEEQWFADEDDEEEEAERERQEKERAEKEREREARAKSTGPSPGRKSGAEPMFPKARTAKADDEDGVFGGSSGGKLGAALGGLANAPKIVIKVLQGEGGGRSRSPSPGSVPPREDEVSSSQAASSSAAAAAAAAPSGAAQKRPAADGSPGGASAPKKGLVEYDDSDSDSDHEESSVPSGSRLDDSLPSSSTGSPTGAASEGGAAASAAGAAAEGESTRKRRADEDEDEDVSSTSGDDAAAGDSGGCKKGSRKRESTEDDDVDDVTTAAATGKRIRVDDDADSAPAPADAAAAQ